ncbi:hypothetical protein [Mycobacterium sp.]|jgi:hypothetical protein|uniref:hypothetical protein n=1 Tax=Mycobacterium sp. TaxID=1785 RepID=UPI003C793AF5
MFTRTIVGAGLIASAIGLGTLGLVGSANAAPATEQPTGWTVYTCYDYVTQTFYDCVG